MYVDIIELMNITLVNNVMFFYVIYFLEAGLYFMLNNAIYLPGEAVFISDIGPEPANHSNFGCTLACITSSVNPICCNNGSVVGDWFYPNHTIVPHGKERNVVDFAIIITLIKFNWLEQMILHLHWEYTHVMLINLTMLQLPSKLVSSQRKYGSHNFCLLYRYYASL